MSKAVPNLDFTVVAPTKQSLSRLVNMIRKVYTNLTTVINGNLGFGDGTNADNVSGTWANVVAPVAPNTDFTITHNLGRLPVGYWVMQKDRACDVYTGSVASTKTQLTLRATVASAVLRLFILGLLLFLGGCDAQAQTTNLTLQVTDLGGQSWNNGTWSVTLVSAPGAIPYGPPFFLVGTSTPVPNQTQSGTLNASGASSGTIPLTQNSGIVPSLSQWSFTVCPQATSLCLTQSVIITATATLTLTPAAISISAGNLGVTAYTDSEVQAGVGQVYFNLTTQQLKVCAVSTGNVCTTWAVSVTSPTSGFITAGAFISNSPNPASTGVFRLASADLVSWRNAVNSSDISISKLGASFGNTPVDTLSLAGFAAVASNGFSSGTNTTATTGLFRLGSGEVINWRNAVNSIDLSLNKTGAASGNVPADALHWGGGGFTSGAYSSGTLTTAASGIFRLASTETLNWRNNANSADLALGIDTSDRVLLSGFVAVCFPTTTFASLGSVPGAGIARYCTDCTTAATCAGAGSGHLAVSNGTNWTCQ